MVKGSGRVHTIIPVHISIRDDRETILQVRVLVVLLLLVMDIVSLLLRSSLNRLHKASYLFNKSNKKNQIN